MTTTLDRAQSPRPGLADAPVGSPGPTGDDLPDRDYFNGCAAPVDFILLDVHLLVGPLTPTPNLTLAEVVRRIAR